MIVFLQTMRDLLGAEHVLDDEGMLRRFSRTTLPQGSTPLAIMRPANRTEVQGLIKGAAAANIAIYPISAGKNWGYGDACAPRSGMVILDLSRMNRILEVNTELAYVVIEPGVTQGQLSDYLSSRHIRLRMDCTGAGPDSSLIGNTLERGFGHSAYGDRFAHSCAYEAVLADGSLFATGFGSYPNAQAQHVYKWGVGPSLDGLLTQSGAAIVTRMTLWLMPRQPSTYFFMTFSDAGALAELAERLRPLYLSGTLRNVLHCANAYRLMAGSTQFPWAEADGKAALDAANPALYQRLRKKFNLMEWSCAGVLTGEKEELAVKCRLLRRALKGMPGLAKLFFLSERTYSWSQHIAHRLPAASFFNPLRNDLIKVRWMVDLLNGKPSYQFLTGAHWRARKVPSGIFDPLDTDSGLIWLGPVLPMTANAVHAVNRLSRDVFREYGFEYQATFSFSNERSMCAILSISFDRLNAEETERARTCETRLFETLMAAGYVPYRGSPSIQRALIKVAPEYWQAVERLQNAWDPQGVVSPGRYGR